jgi:hypothetical protein
MVSAKGTERRHSPPAMRHLRASVIACMLTSTRHRHHRTLAEEAHEARERELAAIELELEETVAELADAEAEAEAGERAAN